MNTEKKKTNELPYQIGSFMFGTERGAKARRSQ